MKKKTILNLIILTLMLFVNADNKTIKFKKNKVIKLIKDDVNKSYLKENYGFASIFFNKYTEENLENVKITARKNIIENNDLTEDEKTNIVDRLKKIKYENDRYFFYQIISDQPFLKNELNFKFQINDSKNNLYLEDVIPCFLKIQEIYRSNISMDPKAIKQREYYNYIWIIKSNIQLNEDNIDINNLPIGISLIFPNGEKKIYEYK